MERNLRTEKVSPQLCDQFGDLSGNRSATNAQNTERGPGAPMTIQRVPDVPFAQIANSALRDKRLSFKARGVLALVLSNVGEWEATLNWLTRQSDKDGRYAIQQALNELTELGYRSVSKALIEGEMRTLVEWRHEPDASISRLPKNLTVGKLDGRETGVSIEHYPLEHHLPEHHLREHRGSQKSTEGFDEFWNAYPRKENKGAARKSWAKALAKADAQTIIAAALAYRDDPNREPEFTAHAASWLNGERWDDEPLPARGSRAENRMRDLARDVERIEQLQGFGWLPELEQS